MKNKLLLSTVLGVVAILIFAFLFSNKNSVFAQDYTYVPSGTNGWDSTYQDCTDCDSYTYTPTYSYDYTPTYSYDYTPTYSYDYTPTYSYDYTPSETYDYSPSTHTCPSGYGTYVYSESECPSTDSYYPQYNYPTYSLSAYYSTNGYGNGYGNYYQAQPVTIVQQQQTNTVQCWNGTYVSNASQCPTRTQTCPNGSVIPVTQSCPTYYCSINGQTYYNQSDYNNYCVQQTHLCWNGQYYPNSQSCPTQYQTCPDGSQVLINQTCPTQYRTCWNGATVLASQSCPAQYQTCWNGSVIPVTQSCPAKVTTTTVKKVEIINHSVITDLVTKVTDTSAQCNGIGLISNGAQSVGWFEYGDTQNLGKTTNSASIGSASESSFSNIITGLKPDTTYYCRAVMSNKDGTYKGKIISFSTLKKQSTKSVYVAPKGTVATKSTPKTKTEFVCSDGSIATAKTVLVGETVNDGGKLISINIERNTQDLIQGSIVNYRITLTNTSDTALTGIVAKIVLPTELNFVDATTTGGITIKDGVMTVPVADMNAKDVKTFILPTKVSDNAEIGKTVVTTVYASYNLPITGTKIVKDEVSSYMIANIVSKDGKSASSTSLLTSGSIASILFPQTLLGWLVLFAVILIIVVLVMNIYRWYQEKKLEKEEKLIHHHTA